MSWSFRRVTYARNLVASLVIDDPHIVAGVFPPPAGKVWMDPFRHEQTGGAYFVAAIVSSKRKQKWELGEDDRAGDACLMIWGRTCSSGVIKMKTKTILNAVKKVDGKLRVNALKL